jgi:hypothetical protein
MKSHWNAIGLLIVITILMVITIKIKSYLLISWSRVLLEKLTGL